MKEVSIKLKKERKLSPTEENESLNPSKKGYSKIGLEDYSFKVQPIELDKQVILNQYRIQRQMTCKLIKAVLAIIFVIFAMCIFMYLTKDDAKLAKINKIDIDKKSVPHFGNEINYFHEELKTDKAKEVKSKANTKENLQIYNSKLSDFFIKQKELNSSELGKLKTNQLRREKQIKYIEDLSISLQVEFNDFIHMEIKDKKNERFEAPKYDLLNKEYLLDLEFNAQKRQKLNKDNLELIKDDYSIVVNDKQNNQINNNSFSFKLFSNLQNTSNTQNAQNIHIKNEKDCVLSFTTSENFLYSDTYIDFEFILTSDDIYGFGERTHNFKLGEGLFTTWPHDIGGTKEDDGMGRMNGYSHQPIGLHKTKSNLWLGFVFMNLNMQDLNIKKIVGEKEAPISVSMSHKTIGGIIDYYIIVGNNPDDVLKKILFLLGRPMLPPYWSLGFHQSRYGYHNDKEFTDVYHQYKEYKIPLDVMWIDIDSLDENEVFTVSKKFSNLLNTVEEIHKDGAKFVPIVDIGIPANDRSEYYTIGKKLNIYIKSNYTKENLISSVWAGDTVFPDFLNPNISRFWNYGLSKYHKLVKFDGIWLDMNEPANLKKYKCVGELVKNNNCKKEDNKYWMDLLPYIPGYRDFKTEQISLDSITENALSYNNFTVYDTKPLISYYECRYTYDYLFDDLKVRPFVLSRSTTIGSGKYTFHWLGDNYSKMENLRLSIDGIFNFNIFGIPMTGDDICGFLDDSNKELCQRWYNLGAFYPFSRNHNFFNSPDQFPWSFSSNSVIENIKHAVNLKYSLIRYFYTQLFLISLGESGSFFKPVLFEFPEEKQSYENIDEKVMIGRGLLLFPILSFSEKEKEVYFPNANFNCYPYGSSIIDYDTNFDNNKINDENRKRLVSGKYSDINLYIRGGHIIPYQNTFDKYIPNTQILRNEELNLIINPCSKVKAKGSLIFDNDLRYTIENKEYARIDIEYDQDIINFTVNKNKLINYNFKDNIIGKIEILRANLILKNKKDLKARLSFNDLKQNRIREVYFDIKHDKENDKLVVSLTGNGEDTRNIFNFIKIKIL